MKHWEYIVITIGLCAMCFSFGFSLAPERILVKETPVCGRLPTLGNKNIPALLNLADAVPASALRP